jgi:hypothetical protein
MPTIAHEKVCKSSEPELGSALYCTTINPSTTTSITAPANDVTIMKETKMFGLSKGKKIAVRQAPYNSPIKIK